jgi:transcriptional regulator with GAF, ATPase, and Fis domain
MKVIYDLMEAVGNRSSTNQILEKATESLFENYPRVDKVSAFLFDDGKQRMEEIVSRSKQDGDGKRSSYTKAILDEVVQEGKIVTLYLKADAAREGFTKVLDTLALITVICLPLMTGDKARGAIYIEGFQESQPVRKEDFLLLKTVKCLFELSLQISDQSKDDANQTRNQKRG